LIFHALILSPQRRRLQQELQEERTKTLRLVAEERARLEKEFKVRRAEGESEKELKKKKKK
jgi:hypothetical protein